MQSRQIRLTKLFAGCVQCFPRASDHSAPGSKAQKLAAFFSVKSPQALYYQALSHWTNLAELVTDSHEPKSVRENIENLSARSKSIEETMMLTDLLNYLPDDILTKIDRASMAVSLEARVPLLDHRVVEFAWTLPLSLKIRKRENKWILRQILYKYVPAALIERPKMGFGVPIDRWLRGPLRDWAESLLSEQKLSEHGLLNAGCIREKWNEHLSGHHNWQYLLWDVLVFQDWFRQNNPVRSKFGANCLKETSLAKAER